LKAEGPAPKTIDEYIATSPAGVRPVLERIRATIRKAVPDAQEMISYRMPTFKRDGVLLHFAAFKEHIGVYPPVLGDAELIKKLSPYANEKGNLRFPLSARIPYALIGEIAKLRARQNAAKAVVRRIRRR